MRTRLDRQRGECPVVSFGRFELWGLLGSGASGSVYLGWDPDARRQVAVKVLEGGSEDAELRPRIEREAALMRQVNDPHCVRVIDVVAQPPDLAIVMSYVESATLREVLDRHGPLTGVQALGVLRGALHGLVAVHRVGLVHGDVKPANIVVARGGNAMLIDFGLTRPVGWHPGAVPEGSPAYMSPEQIRSGNLDARSDVYAAGAVLFELLTGGLPFREPSVAAVLRQHLEDPVPDPRETVSDVGDEIAAVCMTAMAKRPEDRFQTAQAFLDALEEAARQRYGIAWLAGAGLGAVAGTIIAGRPTEPPVVQSGSSDAMPGELVAAEPATWHSRRAFGRAATLSAVFAVLAITILLLVLTSTGQSHPKAAPSKAVTSPGTSAPVPGPNAPSSGSAPASGPTPCTAQDLGTLLPPLAAGEAVRTLDVFGLSRFFRFYSLHPNTDRGVGAENPIRVIGRVCIR